MVYQKLQWDFSMQEQEKWFLVAFCLKLLQRGTINAERREYLHVYLQNNLQTGKTILRKHVYKFN